jgi:hypothetical protein
MIAAEYNSRLPIVYKIFYSVVFSASVAFFGYILYNLEAQTSNILLTQ